MDGLPGVPSASDDIEQSLMDLGLFGVTIKEEVLDDDGTANSKEKTAVVGSTRKTTPEQGSGGADSLESPSTGAGGKSNAWTSTKCIFCEQVLINCETTSGQPKLLECLHSACEGCIQSKLDERRRECNGSAGAEAQGGSVVCPVCEMASQVGSLIEQQFVVERAGGDPPGGAGGAGGAAPAERPCSSCSEDNAATSWCVECADFICDNCVQAHQRLKITKDHTIKSKDDALQDVQSANSSSTTSDLFCKEHTQERLSLFCETCDKLTCRDCQLLHHRDHKYQFSTEMAAQARNFVSSLLSEVSYKRVLLGSAMMVIQERQALIADKKKALVHEITQTVVKLTNTINTRGKQLVLRLNEVCDGKQKTLSEKKAALEQLSAITDHCIGFVGAALATGSDTALLHSKRRVAAHLQRIKSRRADIPNPEIPVRIHLALEKVPDLIKVLSSIGAVMVDGKPYPPAPGAAAAATARPPSAGAVAAAAAARPPSAGAVAPAAALALYNSPPPGALLLHQPSLAHHMQPYQNSHSSRTQQPSPSQQPPPPYPQLATHQQNLQMSSLMMRQNSGGSILPALTQGPVGHPASMARTGPMLRHPHVTSTTHPHHMAGLQNDMNLRGLLGGPQYVQQQQQQQQQQRSVQQQQQQQYRQNQQSMLFQGGGGGPYGAAAGGAGVPGGGPAGGGRAVGAGGPPGRPRTAPSPLAPPYGPPPGPPFLHHHQHQPHPQPPQQPPHAKWHIPQHHANGVYDNGGSTSPYPPQSPSQHHSHDSFKITLGRQPTSQHTSLPPSLTRQPSTPSAVTSTNPKTPSPSLHGGPAADAAVSLDKLCQDSVNDLMATIAKLDSNGVQVLAEGGAGGGPPAGPANGPHSSHSGASPQVHSSTDDTGTAVSSQLNDSHSVDPNEDWCAVCMDGGELMCCDKCPKVFHQYCHIPTIDKLPDESESWQCLLCLNFADLPPEGTTKGIGLSSRKQKIVERIVLEMYCQFELSKHFREPVPLSNIDYHSRIQRPMSLDMIRVRVQPGMSRYTRASEMVNDMRLMFKNVYAYYMPESNEYRDCKLLDAFFEQQLMKWLPEYAYQDASEDQPSPAKRSKLSNGSE